MGRYQELFRIPTNLYIEGSPVIIAAGAIQKDTTNGSILAQLKICNISLKNIISCSVLIKPYEVNGNEIDGVVDYSYLDINVGSGKDFGSKNAIVFPNYKTRRMNISVTEVVFSDGEVWKNDNWDWQPLAEQSTLQRHYSDPEIIKQIKIETKNVAKMMPIVDRNLISCICGTKNLLTNGFCYDCKFDFNKLSHVFDEEYLNQQKNERLERERLEREKELECERIEREEKLEQERLENIKREEARLQREKKKKKIIIITTVVIAIIIAVIITVPTIKSLVMYNSAKKLITSGQYEEAIIAFEALNGYKDSEEKINQCYEAILDNDYNEALAMMNSEKYEEAIAAFEALDGYKDSEDKIKQYYEAISESDYNEALAMMNSEKYEEAIVAFRALGDYKDSEELLVKAEIRGMTNASVGDIVTFGNYNENTKWVVLAVDDGKLLVISQYVLEQRPYNTEYTSVTWESCTLRNWLNETYLTSAFCSNEQALIMPTLVVNSSNLSYGPDGGNDTTDKVFLLSRDEVNEFFILDSDRQATFSNGVSFGWWLRTIGGTTKDRTHVAYVTSTGSVDGHGNSVHSESVAVRPAFWIDISK